MHDFRECGDGIYLFDAGYVRPQLAAIHMVVEKGRVAFVDTGTNSALPAVLAALQRVGLDSSAVDYVILSHIHLDHAGGAGAMMRAFPHARLVVHPRGARHMAEPSRLVTGVIGVYGEDYVRRMYGEVLSVPAERISPAPHEQVFSLAGRELLCLDTPGHARHHICIVDRRTGGIFTGDTFGLAYPQMDVGGRKFIFPTTTPTQFEPEAMHRSIDLLMSYRPVTMYLTHYGPVHEPGKLRDDLLRRLDAQIEMALAEKQAGDERHARIKARLFDYLTAEARHFGCPLSEEELRNLWESDCELNAQGLSTWLDGVSS